MHSIARVLVAGRDEPNLNALHQLLESAGHVVSRTECAEEAALRFSAGEADVVLLADDALASLRRELSILRARVSDAAQRALVGRSPAIGRVRELVGRAAAARAPVLVTGERGTGKDIVARLIHDLSERAARPFVSVRCAGADLDALQRELFGCAASDGARARAGLLEEARGGTIVLDDADALPPTLRTQLARASASRTSRRVGSQDAILVDVRLILIARESGAESDAASIEDLLVRFNAIELDVPPLRDRRSDIPLLVQNFRQRLAEERGLEPPPLTSDEMLSLPGREWTGNVRELEHWVERHALGARVEQPGAAPGVLPGVDLRSSQATLEQLERAYIMHVLALESGHQSRTALRLGIDRRTLYRKLKQYRTA
jgi:DNA-binding NtrC family response regulator